jgi:lysozyme family protein
MSRFDECLKFVLRWEGGYTYHPYDRGGPTNKGIIQRVYDEWQSSHSLPLQSVKDITDSEVADIYRDRYWSTAGCDRVPSPVDLVLFDSSVNCGPRQAVKWLQRAAEARADGVIGPKTLAAVSEFSPELIAHATIDQREDFYHELVMKDPRQSVFLLGWLNRINSLRNEVNK